MTFTTRFQSFVCEGDSISCEVAGFEIVARIVRDDCPDAPDERQDGFWPSLYKDAPGFIGPGNNFRQRFAKAQARAEAVMEAWRQDEWFYCGIVLSVSFEGVELERHAASLWGIEANYPDSDNAYLTDVANELLPEALDAGCAIIERLTTPPRQPLAMGHRHELRVRSTRPAPAPDLGNLPAASRRDLGRRPRPDHFHTRL